MQFLTQYGAIPKIAKPEARLAILATTAQHRYARYGNFHYNASYNILTRLGIPPVILHERQLANANPAPKVLVLANEHHDLLAATKAQIEKLQASGTKLLVVGRIPHGIKSDQHVKNAPETIYDTTQDPGLAKNPTPTCGNPSAKTTNSSAFPLLNTGLTPLAQTDPLRAYAVTLDDGLSATSSSSPTAPTAIPPSSSANPNSP